jgi:hypothetical protein
MKYAVKRKKDFKTVKTMERTQIMTDDPVMFREPEFEKQSYRPIASRLSVLQNQTIQINGNFGTKFCGVLFAVRVTYLALFISQCRGQILVNL